MQQVTLALYPDQNQWGIKNFVNSVCWVCGCGGGLNGCCVFQPANACLRLRSHGWKRSKTSENDNKIPNEQPAFGCQPAFGSHSQSLTNNIFSSFFFIFLPYSSCALHEPLVRMMEKILFSLFSNVFDRFQPCQRMRKHVFAGRITQQWLPW